MGLTEFVGRHIQFVLHSAPAQLAVLALELTAHYAASALESLVGLDEPKSPGTTPQDPVKKAKDDDLTKESKDKDEVENKDISETGASLLSRLKAYWIQSVQLLVMLLRWAEHWLRSISDQAPSVDGPVEERRRVVAKKRLEQFSLLTRTCRCALYAATDTLRDMGVTVQWLECAKGTLHVSGDKEIDNSPVKGRSSVTPNKRKEFEQSDDEEEEMGFFEQLERSYDSQEDEDYEPPSNADVSTDSEEYKDGQTDDEESELGAEEDPAKPLAPRASIPAESAARTDEKVEVQQETVNESGGTAGAGEREEVEMTVMEQLNKSYDSQEDADYIPPCDDDASTDSEEFKSGQTESDLSDQCSTEEPVAPRTKTTAASSKEAADENVNGKASANPIKALASENGVETGNGVKMENDTKDVVETIRKVDPMKQKSVLDRTP